MKFQTANRIAADGTLRSASSHLGLYCLPGFLLGLRYVSWYKYLIVSLVFPHLGFWSGNLFLIAPIPDLCLLVPFYKIYKGCGKIKWTKSVSWVSIFQLVQIIISLALCYSLITAITRNGNEKITFCHIC